MMCFFFYGKYNFLNDACVLIKTFSFPVVASLVETVPLWLQSVTEEWDDSCRAQTSLHDKKGGHSPLGGVVFWS